MKYVNTQGEWREFRGRVFWGRKPVEITDKGTLEAIKHTTGFQEFHDEHEQAQEVKAAPQVLAQQEPQVIRRKGWRR